MIQSIVTWSCEVSAETLRLMRRELEWALQHQRARLVERLPQHRLGLRTRQRAGFVVAVLLLAFSLWLWTTQPGLLPPWFVIASAAIAVVALVAVPFVPRYFAWAARAVGKRLARRAEAALHPLEGVVPTTAHYTLHEGRLAMRLGDRELPPLSLDKARAINDQLKAITDKYPKRLGGFAALPTQDPQAAAAELERCVTQYGFHGALINSFSNLGDAESVIYLDDPRYDVLWERAQALDLPIYLHPRNPLASQQMMFKGHPELLAAGCRGNEIWSRTTIEEGIRHANRR